jgi:hypothetical protein
MAEPKVAIFRSASALQRWCFMRLKKGSHMLCLSVDLSTSFVLEKTSLPRAYRT